MERKTRLFIQALSLWLAIIVAWDIVLYLREDKATDLNYLFNVGYAVFFLAGAAASFLFARRHRWQTNLGKAFVIIGAGLLGWGLGNFVWAYYNVVLKVEVPYPSLADGVYILFYPLLAIGAWYIVKMYSPFLTTVLVIESLVIILVATAVTFSIYSPDLEGLSGVQQFFSLAYPIGDVIILSTALIALRIGGGHVRRGFLIFIVGVLLQTIGDYLFTYRTNKEIYWNGDIADSFYAVAAFVMAVGVSLIAAMPEFQRAPTPLPPRESSLEEKG
jgi:hypothetical protein